MQALNLQKSSCLSPMAAGITGQCHHGLPWAHFLIWVYTWKWVAGSYNSNVLFSLRSCQTFLKSVYHFTYPLTYYMRISVLSASVLCHFLLWFWPEKLIFFIKGYENIQNDAIFVLIWITFTILFFKVVRCYLFNSFFILVLRIKLWTLHLPGRH